MSDYWVHYTAKAEQNERIEQAQQDALAAEVRRARRRSRRSQAGSVRNRLLTRLRPGRTASRPVSVRHA